MNVRSIFERDPHVCDFCSADDPPYRIRVKTFPLVWDGHHMESLGDWLACDDCYVLIEADDREGLFQRSSRIAEERCAWMFNEVDSATAKVMHEASDQGLRMMQNLFWKNRL